MPEIDQNRYSRNFSDQEGKQLKGNVDYVPFEQSIESADPPLKKRLIKKQFLLPLHAFKGERIPLLV